MNPHFIFLINKASSDMVKIDHIKASGNKEEQELRKRLLGSGLICNKINQ